MRRRRRGVIAVGRLVDLETKKMKKSAERKNIVNFSELPIRRILSSFGQLTNTTLSSLST
jgi:hypothetical protein